MTGSTSRGVAKRRPSHPCTRCGKDFTKRSNMLIHERLHTGERPYVCRFDGCGRSYKWLSSINFHEGRCERKAFGLAITAPSSSSALHSSSPGSPVTPVRAFSSELVLPSPEQMARMATVRTNVSVAPAASPFKSGRSNATMPPPPRKRVATSPVNSPLRISSRDNASGTSHRFLHAPLAPAPMSRELPLPHPHAHQYYLPHMTPPVTSGPVHAATAAVAAPPMHQMHYANIHPHPPLHRMLPPAPQIHQHHHHSYPQHIAGPMDGGAMSNPTSVPSTLPPHSMAATIPMLSSLPVTLPPVTQQPPQQQQSTAQIKEEEYAMGNSSELFSSDNQQCTVTGGVLDELTSAGYSFENDPTHSEVLLF